MKKILMLFAAVAIVLGAASCQKENLGQEVTPGEEKIDYSDDPMGVIKVYIKKDDTKMAFEEKNNALYRSWEIEDVIDGCTKVGDEYKSFQYAVVEVGTDADGDFVKLKKNPGATGIPSATTTEPIHFVYAPGAVKFAADGNCSLDLSKQKEGAIPAVMVASGTIVNGEGNPKLSLKFNNIAAVLEIKNYSMSLEAEDWASFGSVTVDALTKSTLTINDGGTYELGTCEAGKATVTVSEERTKGEPVFVAILPGNNIDIKARFNDVVAGNEKIGNFAWAPASKVNVPNNGFVRIQEKTFDFAPVAQIGDEKYGYISKAFAEAQTGNTITLLDDCLAEEKLLIDKSDVILDLAGKTLSCQKLGTVDCNITVNGENTFTIKDTDSDNKGRIDVSSQSSGIWPVCAENGATLVIDGGAIAGKAVEAVEEGAIKVLNSNLTIKGGSISGSSESTIDIANEAEEFKLFEIFDGEVSSQYRRSLKIAGNIHCAFLGGDISSLMKDADVSSNTIQFTRLKIDDTDDYGKPQAIMAGSTVYVNQQENLADKSYSAIYAHYGEVFVLSGTLENKGQSGGVIKSYGAKVTVRPASLPTWDWLKEDYQLDDRKSTEETKNLHIKCPSSCSYGLFFTNGKNGEITAYKYIDTQAGGTGTESAGLIARVSSEGGTITIAGGTYYGGADNGTVYVQGGNFKVTGGSLYGHGGTSSGGPKGTIYCNGEDGNVTIGGSSSSTANIYGDGWGGAIRVDKGKVNIEAKASVKCYYTSSSTNPQVRIKGGEFNLHDGVIGSSGSTTVDGVSNRCYRGISLSDGTFNMTGGELRAYNSCIYCDGKPTIAISGGLLRNGTSGNSCFQITGSSSDAKITISPAVEGQYPQIYQYKADSGTQANPVKLTSGGASPKITGGYFYVKSADVLSNYLASGYTTEEVPISSKTYYHVIKL